MDDERDRILLTGATGYVGGRLLQRLEHQNRRLRCLTRRPSVLARRVGSTSEIVAGDLLQPESLAPAMNGVQVAYYLVHSMDAPGASKSSIGARRPTSQNRRERRASATSSI